MPVIDTFSKRKAKADRGGVADVYQYDVLPDGLRHQIVRILQRTIGLSKHASYGYSPATALWQWLYDAMTQELGRFNLVDHEDAEPREQCCAFLLKAETLPALDLIELAFLQIDRVVRDWYPGQREVAEATQWGGDAIDELNTRFREHGVGYQFDGGQIVALNSEYVHAEAVVPAIQLLQNPAFAGASQEFLGAHRHYREGRYKEAMVDALKAFESTMKTICDARRWTYDPGITSKGLIEIVFRERLLPMELTSHFSALRLAAGVRRPDAPQSESWTRTGRNTGGGAGLPRGARPAPSRVEHRAPREGARGRACLDRRSAEQQNDDGLTLARAPLRHCGRTYLPATSARSAPRCSPRQTSISLRWSTFRRRL